MCVPLGKTGEGTVVRELIGGNGVDNFIDDSPRYVAPSNG